jgi:hypothetical protein
MVFFVFGGIAAAAALQEIYEQAFGLPHRRIKDLPYRLAWLAVLIGASLLGGWAGPWLRHGGPALLAAAGLVWATGFWWLTMRILLAGRISWRALFPAACATGVLYVAMQTVFSLVFSAMVISDEHTYGPIGTIFALLSYLIAIGVVVILGAAAGRSWRERSPDTSETGHLPPPCPFGIKVLGRTDIGASVRDSRPAAAFTKLLQARLGPGAQAAPQRHGHAGADADRAGAEVPWHGGPPLDRPACLGRRGRRVRLEHHRRPPGPAALRARRCRCADRDRPRRGLPDRRVMRLGSAARVAATATGIIAVVYVLGVIVLNLVVDARLAQQNDNRLAGRLAAASHDPEVFSQRALRTFRGAGDSDADSAPVFFWLVDARQAVSAHSPGAPALPARPLGSQQPRDGPGREARSARIAH